MVERARDAGQIGGLRCVSRQELSTLFFAASVDNTEKNCNNAPLTGGRMSTTSSASCRGISLKLLALNHLLREVLLCLQEPFCLSERDDANNIVHLCALHLERLRPPNMERQAQTRPLLPVLLEAIEFRHVVRSERSLQLSNDVRALLDAADIIYCSCRASTVRWKLPENGYCYNCGGLM